MQNNASPQRSPQRDRPLRYAGPSLEAQIERLNEDVVIFFLFSLGIAVLALLDWIRYLNSSQITPWVSTIVALLVVIYSIVRLWKIRQKLNLLKLRRDGEKIVVENLEYVKKQRGAVLHDLVSEGYNIDHVVCSPRGIFVIQTMTPTRQARGKPTVNYDGKRILIDGVEPEDDPVGKATALASWMESLLLVSAHKRFPIKPVILFPGWSVEPGPEDAPVWVLNPAALHGFIMNSRGSIDEADLHRVIFHLTRYIRVPS